MGTIGCVQVYTGNGKGKTTAAMGLVLRALGAGMRVYFGQFMKCGEMCEIKALRTFAEITIDQYGDGTELSCPSAEDDRAAAQTGYSRALQALQTGAYDVVILDELNVAVHLGHIDEAQAHALLAARPEKTELVLTGRWAKQSVMDAADLVTEMREIKHYYNAGIPARRGIEC